MGRGRGPWGTQRHRATRALGVPVMEAESLAPTVPEQTAARVWVPESRKQTPVLAGLSRSQRRPPPGMPRAVQHLLVMAAGPPGTWGDILGGTLKPVMHRSPEAKW